jgi:hypothetical protein
MIECDPACAVCHRKAIAQYINDNRRDGLALFGSAIPCLSIATESIAPTSNRAFGDGAAMSCYDGSRGAIIHAPAVVFSIE